MTKQIDIGDYLDVSEGEREDADPTPEYNADAGFDVQVVPNGVYVELSTAGDETLAEDEEDEGDPGDLGDDGSPLEFLSPNDPDGWDD